jgi:hypothetical protein
MFRPHYIGAEYGFIRGIQWGEENTYNGAKFTLELLVNIIIPF